MIPQMKLHVITHRQREREMYFHNDRTALEYKKHERIPLHNNVDSSSHCHVIMTMI
jgi:hypothetical protein